MSPFFVWIWNHPFNSSGIVFAGKNRTLNSVIGGGVCPHFNEVTGQCEFLVCYKNHVRLFYHNEAVCQLFLCYSETTMTRAKKRASLLIVLLLIGGWLQAQDDEIFILPQTVDKNKTIVYKRVIRFVKNRNLWHVRDYFENGQMQMEAFYSSFDRNIKEQYQCNYRSNTKEGEYRQWYKNGQIEFSGNYDKGLWNGPSTSWYENGKKEAEENWLHGQLHGEAKYWSEQGELQFDLNFDHGLNRNPADAHYLYLSYVPKGYDDDTTKKWPLIIYLHGGSRRGSDLTGIGDGSCNLVFSREHWCQVLQYYIFNYVLVSCL